MKRISTIPNPPTAPQTTESSADLTKHVRCRAYAQYEQRGREQAMNAYIRIVVFILSLSMMPSLSSAQSRCPYGTEYAGTLSGQGTDIEKLDRHETIKLPEKVTLDESYQQTRLTASNDTGKKNTNLRPQDVPKGILIIPTGSRDYPVRWAVSEPKLTAFERDKNGTITQYEFEMHLFCSMETSEFDRQTNSCNVDVVVCFKPMK